MRIKPQIKGALKAIALMGLLLVSAWLVIGFRLGIWGPGGYVAYVDCVVGISPLGSQLWHGRIKPGDSLTDLLARVNPSRVSRYGQWTEVEVIPGCSKLPDDALILSGHLFIVAKSDSIACAGYGSCTFQREFFNVLTAVDEHERQSAHQKYVSRLKQARKTPPITPALE